MSKTKTKNQKQPENTVDVRVLKALGHPLRQQILQVLNDEIASPNEIAQKLGEPLGNVSYHVKILVNCDAIELVRTAPVRGALEHFYEAKMRARLEEDHWKMLPDSVRRELFDQTLQQIWTHVSDASEAGGFDDVKTSVAWVALELDDQGYDEMSQEIVALFDRAMAIQAGSQMRLEKLDEEQREQATHNTEFAAMHFHKA